LIAAYCVPGLIAWPAVEVRDHEPTEDRLLRRLRAVSVVVILVLLVFLVVIDTLGKVFINASFGVSDVIFGSLIGGLFILLGVEVWSRIPTPGGRS
jgi:hypothetical protein